MSVSGVYVHLNGKRKITLKPAIALMLFVYRNQALEFKKWLGG
ncbi:hypothetical protein BN8_02805 [Fibrisoma limi BUZ 3]|uniref:Uncharacterized protein n=1 Tax=Fibrisoma limi BUZ 3 TaxID=1185876 RepID=I2GIG6_9BACT|nr:hypothetical protein [Fibrisoma limi]CCH53691.1 hypothetical protein BN8_02805 [Fibrisoma limi BUZ 3]